MEIGALNPSLNRLLSATRAAQSRMQAPVKAATAVPAAMTATPAKPSSVAGLSAAYATEKTPASTGRTSTAAPDQNHLGNFFDRIV